MKKLTSFIDRLFAGAGWSRVGATASRTADTKEQAGQMAVPGGSEMCATHKNNYRLPA
jgi:hypothetical protein